MTQNKNTIPAVEKTIRLLETLSESSVHAGTVSELAKMIDISVTSCFRILRTLEAANWIYSPPEGGYRISAGITGILNPVCMYRDLVDRIGPQANVMSKTLGLSVKISVRQGDEYVTLYCFMPPLPYSINSRPNCRFPLLAGATGSALLQDEPDEKIRALMSRSSKSVWKNQTVERFFERLRECRTDGYVADFGSYYPDVCTLAAGVRNASGEIACALTLLGMPHDFSDEGRRRETGSAILETVGECEKILALP